MELEHVHDTDVCNTGTNPVDLWVALIDAGSDAKTAVPAAVEDDLAFGCHLGCMEELCSSEYVVKDILLV